MSIIQVFKPTSGPIPKGIINVPEPDDEFAFTRAEKLKLAHLSTGSTGELITLVSNLTETVNNNYNLLTGETVDRISGDIINHNLITGLTSTVVTNYNLLTGETANRISNDVTNYNLITGETTSRISQDLILNNQITGLTSNILNNYDLITGETANRISGDIINYNLITGETDNRISGDITNYSLITGETDNRILGDITNYNLITGETANRISGETAINNRIDNLPTGNTSIPNLMWLGSGLYNITSTDDIIIAPELSTSLVLPDLPTDKRKILIKNLSASDIPITSNNHSIDFSGFPYNLKAGAAITITFYNDGNTWVIESDFTIQVTGSTNSSVPVVVTPTPPFPYNSLITDDVIITFDSDVSLPVDAFIGKYISIKNIGTNIKNIYPSGTVPIIETYSVGAPYPLSPNECLVVMANTINGGWLIISKYVIPTTGSTGSPSVVVLTPGMPYTVLNTDDIIVGDGASNQIFLPSDATDGEKIVIKNRGVTAEPITPQFGNSIGILAFDVNYDLSSGSTISLLYNSIFSNWIIESEYNIPITGSTEPILPNVIIPPGMPYTAQSTDDVIIANGSFNDVYLPSGVLMGKYITVKNVGIDISNVYPSGMGNQIESFGPTTPYLLNPTESVVLIYDQLDDKWLIVSDHIVTSVVTGSTAPVMVRLNQLGLGIPYVILDTDDIIIANGSANDMFLPSNASNGKEIIIKNYAFDSAMINAAMPSHIDYLAMNVPYVLPAGSTITLLYDDLEVKWNIESEFNLPVSGGTTHIISIPPGDYNISPTDEIILINNLSENIYLPITGETGKQYIIKNLIPDTVYVKVTGGALFENPISGYLTYNLKGYASVVMLFDNLLGNWVVISNYDKTDNNIIKYVGITESYIISLDDDIILLNGAGSTAWLPPISTIKYAKQYTIKNISPETTILFTGEINGFDNNANPSKYLTSNSSITVVADIINLTWLIIDTYIPEVVFEIITEAPTGVTDGTNFDFTLSRTPKDMLSINAWVSGSLSRVIGVSPNAFRLATAPNAPSSFIVVYQALPI